ncbi:hypothetical protein AAFN85_12270 [Mucilaginibacter sp. CAU 1740]|uniref:hypothetical protein n=1 Tax=Mucilaginibacter sp. CAU 1740 TaxID=3140365 RepID=UPI00325AB670
MSISTALVWFDNGCRFCNFSTRNFSFSAEDLLPNAGAMAGWGTYIKEGIGYVVTVLFK